MTPDGLRPHAHRFDSPAGAHLFLADGSRIYDLADEDARAISRVLDGRAGPDDAARAGVLLASLLPADASRRHIGPEPLDPPPLQALSLNVAQACNMSCGYCYADAGRFGGPAGLMAPDTARAAVDRLLAESAPESDVVVGFMGGEPLLNRAVVHDATRYAADMARRRRRRVRFSITTNGTLLTRADVELFASFPFTVTVSIDGPPPVHRRARLLNGGGDAYARLESGLALLAAHGRPRHLSARITVTPLTGDLLPVLEHVIGLGFDAAGFAPVIVSPVPALAFSEAQMSSFLARMVACGTRTLERLGEGRHYPFDNFETAMHEIHRGTHRPYPCGAGAAYLSAGATGDLFACHRLIDDPHFAMGHVREGLDHDRRGAHLRASHVDRAEPCRGCWARYLCGGGCYHEVSRRGRVACDYIRGWLHFCLGAYVELLERRPEYFHER